MSSNSTPSLQAPDCGDGEDPGCCVMSKQWSGAPGWASVYIIFITKCLPPTLGTCVPVFN